MNTVRVPLAERPWLSLLIVLLAMVASQVLCAVLAVALFKLPRDAPWTGAITTTLAHAIVLFVLAPFVLGLPAGRPSSFRAYLASIRLSQVQPFGRLLLLGLSCYLILALCQVSGVLVYRALQGRAITGAFLRGVLDLSGDLPPKSWGLLVSFPSIFEEVAFRGVILALFMRRYPKLQSVGIAALGFGVLHLLNLASGKELVWVLGQAAWSTTLGLFYGYLVLKSGSLVPAMLVHYLGNLFVGSLTAYVQRSASTPVQVGYGIIFTFGLLPTALMILWVRLYTSLWPIVK